MKKRNNGIIKLEKDVHISITANQEEGLLSSVIDGDLTDIALILAYLIRKHPDFARAIKLAQAIQVIE